MSDTCIVCLGDLGESSSEVPALSSALAKSPVRNGNEQRLLTDSKPSLAANIHNSNTTNDGNESALIAHLQPCGHNLHNDCLTPWVERANSCPICRKSFHSVQLSDRVGGDVISSYAVEDKTQVAEIDPSMFLEVPEDDLDAQPCQVCEEDDNEDVLMYCDGCQKLWHTYCVGLQEVPYGHWFCDNCRAQREVNPRQNRSRNNGRSGLRPYNRRTRGQQRRYRSQHNASDLSYTQVWQSVWDRINLDLDFPYDDEENAASFMRRHRQRNEANRREHEAWQRRVQVAELHGAGGRFRETVSTLLDHRNAHSAANERHNHQSPSAEAEDTDEMIAWHAFDQARAADTHRPKKRKSTTTSPVEPEGPRPVRPLKRMRRSPGHVAAETSDSAASSTIRRPSPRVSPHGGRTPPVNPPSGPSFLQSLLKEVEDSNMPNGANRVYRPFPITATSPAGEQHSPQPSSPALSPLPSNHSSPRAMSATPPPHAHGRPNSPTGLSSSIQPVFPSTEPSLSPSSPEPQATSSETRAQTSNGTKPRVPIPIAQPTPKSRIPRALQNTSPPSIRSRSNEVSPNRPIWSFSAKTDVQKMVSSALKPFYNDQTISKDEYTTVNRDISRMLYDKIGDFEALDIEGKARWEKIAGDEVKKAVSVLKSVSIVNGCS